MTDPSSAKFFHGPSDRPTSVVVEGVVRPAPPVQDLRGLEAPEPFHRALLAVSALKPGEIWLGRTPRVPRMLLPRLADRGLPFEVVELEDGSGLVLCWRPG